jgi:hypothetical protein
VRCLEVEAMNTTRLHSISPTWRTLQDLTWSGGPWSLSAGPLQETGPNGVSDAYRMSIMRIKRVSDTLSIMSIRCVSDAYQMRINWVSDVLGSYVGWKVRTMFVGVHTHTTPTHTSFQAPSSLRPSGVSFQRLSDALLAESSLSKVSSIVRTRLISST